MSNVKLVTRSFFWGVIFYYAFRILVAIFFALAKPLDQLNCFFVQNFSDVDPLVYPFKSCASVAEYLTDTIKSFITPIGIVFALIVIVPVAIVIFFYKKNSR